MKENQKIISIDVLRLNYNHDRVCKCENPGYEIDFQNRLVYCQTCGAIVDPFEALYNLALKYEEINEQIINAIEYRNNLQNYKPYLKEAKRLEREMRNKDMLPMCPKCRKLFKWEDVVEFGNRRFYKDD